MSPTSQALKEDGNKKFQSGDFVGAEALYSQALISDPKNPLIYTNRAMARLKLSQWDSAIADCTACLSLGPDSMKAHYYLSQAHVALRDSTAALTHALRAHELCVATHDRSLAAVTAQVLRCKRERWEDRDRRRRRGAQELESEVVAMLERERDRVLKGLEGADRSEVAEEWVGKIETAKLVFERARAADDRRREVPEWAVDDISFGIMVDPVITKTGKSYERASILEHLKRQQTDPLTREPLQATDLRPNLDLKQACDEFLEENGWAVDW